MAFGFIAKLMATQKQIEANRRNARMPGTGRPKGYVAIQAEKQRKATVKILQKEWTPMVKKLVTQVKESGNVEAFKALRDHAFGKPKETKDLNVNDRTSLYELAYELDDD